MTYQQVKEILLSNGETVVTVKYSTGEIVSMEIYCSPIMMNDKVKELRELFPDNIITKMPNHDYSEIREPRQTFTNNKLKSV